MALHEDASGTVMVEYAVVLALLSVVLVLGLQAVATVTFTALSTLQGNLLTYGLRPGSSS
jgi:Flp pilus assembly pilin Flp